MGSPSQALRCPCKHLPSVLNLKLSASVQIWSIRASAAPWCEPRLLLSLLVPGFQVSASLQTLYQPASSEPGCRLCTWLQALYLAADSVLGCKLSARLQAQRQDADFVSSCMLSVWLRSPCPAGQKPAGSAPAFRPSPGSWSHLHDWQGGAPVPPTFRTCVPPLCSVSAAVDGGECTVIFDRFLGVLQGGAPIPPTSNTCVPPLCPVSRS